MRRSFVSVCKRSRCSPLAGIYETWSHLAPEREPPQNDDIIEKYSEDHPGTITRLDGRRRGAWSHVALHARSRPTTAKAAGELIVRNLESQRERESMQRDLADPKQRAKVVRNWAKTLKDKKGRDLEDLEKIVDKSRDASELLDAWLSWHDTAKEQRPRYARFLGATRAVGCATPLLDGVDFKAGDEKGALKAGAAKKPHVVATDELLVVQLAHTASERAECLRTVYTPVGAKSEITQSAAVPRDRARIYDYFRHSARRGSLPNPVGKRRILPAGPQTPITSAVVSALRTQGLAWKIHER